MQVQSENSEHTEITPTNKDKGVIHKILYVAKQAIAILFWLYVIIKLFIFDFDIYFITKLSPEYVKVLNYKIFIILGFVSLIWLVTKNIRIVSWTLYILFYPIILFFWKIPFFVLKQRSWLLAFAFINFIISFFRSIKYTFILFSLYMISIAAICIIPNKYVIWPAMLVIFLITVITYINRFILIFKPSSVFQLYTIAFEQVKTYGFKSTSLFKIDAEIKSVPFDNFNDRQLEKWTTTLQTSVLYNRICLFVAKKLRDYQTSRLNIVYCVFGILTLILLTVFSFAVINYGLFKIDAKQFSYIEMPTIFTFIYYSFNNLLFNNIREITCVLPISQTISMSESFLALFLVAIFVTILISVSNEKHTEELNHVIRGIEAQGSEMESFIHEEYKIKNIHEAIAELVKVKAGFVKFIYIITDNLK